MGDPDDLRRMLEAFEERNASAAQHEETMGRLVESTTALATAVEVLRRDMARRPTKQQVDHRRRISLGVVVALMLVTAGLSALNTDRCGPGYRAERALTALAAGERDPVKIAAAGQPRHAAACDALVPISAHGEERFPNRWSALGWLGYLLLFATLALWARGPDEDGVPSDS